MISTNLSSASLIRSSASCILLLAASNLTQRQSPNHKWAGTSPSNQEAYSKPLYQLQPQGGQTPEVREVTTLLSVKRSPHQKPIKMKRQRTITQMKEKEKNSEKQLSDLEILSFQEKDFRLLMLKMKTLEINWRQRWISYRKY